MGLGKLQVSKKLGVHIGRIVLPGMNEAIGSPLGLQRLDDGCEHHDPRPGADHHRNLSDLVVGIEYFKLIFHSERSAKPAWIFLK